MSFAQKTTPELCNTEVPAQPHTLRSRVGRGGNGKQSYWVCQDCKQRIIEVHLHKEGDVRYYHVPSCQPAIDAFLAHVPGTQVKEKHLPPSNQVNRVATPPYPWPDKNPTPDSAAMTAPMGSVIPKSKIVIPKSKATKGPAETKRSLDPDPMLDKTVTQLVEENQALRQSLAQNRAALRQANATLAQAASVQNRTAQGSQGPDPPGENSTVPANGHE